MNKPKNIHKAAQLIEGLGASSWFTIALEKNLYRIERFSLEGVLECSGLFNVTTDTFDINSLYSFTYIYIDFPALPSKEGVMVVV